MEYKQIGETEKAVQLVNAAGAETWAPKGWCTQVGDHLWEIKKWVIDGEKLTWSGPLANAMGKSKLYSRPASTQNNDYWTGYIDGLVDAVNRQAKAPPKGGK